MTNPAQSDSGRGTLGTYIAGFVLSLGLTLAAYLFVVNHALRTPYIVATIAVLAVLQLLVQLVFFLHMGRESRPRWNLTVLLFALLVVVIIVFGSLWIMQNLDYQAGHSMPTDRQIMQDEGFAQ